MAAAPAGFACSACGHCCRQVGAVLAALDPAVAATFPHPVRADGACSQLGDDHRCRVYATRPLICNVEAMYAHAAPPQMSRAEWYALNASFCPPEARP